MEDTHRDDGASPGAGARTVAVVGLGHIGLPTALLLAQEHDVVGIDIDEDTVAALEAGDLPFVEPGMPELFDSVADRFSAQTTVPETADTYIVAVPSPLDEVTEVADLTYVRAATETVADAMSPGDMVILESTVPPGTTERLVEPILKRSEAGDDFDYAYCPERAIPGDTLGEMTNNDRVMGGKNDRSRRRARDLYGFVEGEIHLTDPTTAEFVKLIENTYRDVNIALANELGKLAEQYGIDGRDAISMANEHPRVDIHSPGPGVGGHCLPIDPQFLSQASTDSRLISLSREINDLMPVHVLRLVRDLLGERSADATVTVLGVAYKGNVEDTRETPALRLLRLAENEGYDVRVHDPHVESFDYELQDLESAVEDSDCLVVVTDHRQFAALDPADLADRMRTPTVLDTREVLDLEAWEDAGFDVRRLADGS